MVTARIFAMSGSEAIASDNLIEGDPALDEYPAGDGEA